MSENIKIGVSANVDLGGLDSALANAAKSADALSKSMSGGALSLDTVEFEQQINKSTALLKVLYEKIQEKKQLGISTETADAQLKEFTQRKSDATKVLLGSQPSNGGQTPTQRAEQVNRKEIEETTRVLQRYNREATSRDGAEVVRRTKYSQNAHAKYHHGSFVELDSDTSPGAIAERNRIMRNARVSPGKAGAGPGGKAANLAGFGGRLGSAAAGMAGGMMAGGAGGDGMATAGSALGGIIGGAFGPAGAMIGGALGGMAGGLVGSGMGDAKEEAIGISDLRSSLGATTTDFNALRESTRAAASGMGITYQESVKLARQFAHNANTSSKDAGNIASEVRLASGLSRALGLDPSQGVDAMGALRNTGATTDEAGSRKMALTIAEGVSKGGMSSKSDEVLSAIASFAQTTARASLQSPNVGGYTDFLANLVSMKTPGLDVQGSASLMGKADSGIRSHGDAATDTFKLGAYMKAFGAGFSGADMQLYTAGGAMGTARKTAESIVSDPNATVERKKSAQSVLDSGNADRVNQDIMMQQLKRFGRGSSEYELSGARVMNMEHAEFRKFDEGYYKNGESTEGMQAKLAGMGIKNVGKMDIGKFAHMGALLGSNKDELQAEAEKLVSGDGYDKKLSKDEKEKILDPALKSGNEEQLRQAVVKLNEDRSLVDDGKAVRQNTADMKNAITALSSALLPAVDSVREAILFAFGKKDEWEKHQQNERLKDRFKDIKKEADVLEKKDGSGFIIHKGTAQQTIGAKSDWIRAQEEEARAKDDKEQEETATREKNKVPSGAPTNTQVVINNRTVVGKIGRPALPAETSSSSAGDHVSSSKNLASMGSFISENMGFAKDAAKKIGGKVDPSYLLGQVGLETGWGGAIDHNNVGNIKAGAGWKGATFTKTTPEYNSKGEKVSSEEKFRAYPSLKEGWDDYANMLGTSKNYVGVKDAGSGRDYAGAIKAGGYATDPDYAGKLEKTISSVQKNTGGGVVASGGSETKTFIFKMVDKNDKQIGNPVVTTFNPSNPSGMKVAQGYMASVGL